MCVMEVVGGGRGEVGQKNVKEQEKDQQIETLYREILINEKE